jgi:hypothetical protein
VDLTVYDTNGNVRGAGGGGGGATGYLSAGTSSMSLGTVTLSNSNGVSFGLSNGVVTCSVAGAGAAGSISAGTTSVALGQVIFSNSNGVSFGLNGSTVTATVQTNYLTTADLSANSSKYAQAWELTGNTSGTTSSLQGTKWYFEGGNSLTIHGTSNTLRFSVGNYLTTADLSQNSSNYVRAWELTGNTAGTTSSLQGTKLYFEGGNSITVSGNSNTIKLSVGNYITTAALSGDTSKYAGVGETVGTIAGTDLAMTVNTDGVSIGYPKWITTAALSGDTSKYAQAWELTGNTSGTTSSLQGTKWYLEGGNSLTIHGTSNTLRFSVGNYLTTAALSQDSSKYAGTSTGFTGANISASMTHNTAGLALSMSVAAPGAAAEANWINLLGANTAGNTTASGSTIGWSAGNGLTLSGTNGSQVVISVGPYITTAMLSNAATISNIKVSAGTSSINLSDLYFADSNGLSFGLNGSTITAKRAYMSAFRQMGQLTTIGTQQSNTLASIQPFVLPYDCVFSNMLLAGSFNVGTAANNSSAFIDLSATAVFYSRNASTLSSLFSMNNTFSLSFSSNATASCTGVMNFPVTVAQTTLTEGEYWIALHVSTTNTGTGAATTALGNSMSMILSGSVGTAALLARPFGQGSATSYNLFHGQGLALTAATMQSVAFTNYQVTGTRAHLAMFAFELRNQSYDF